MKKLTYIIIGLVLALALSVGAATILFPQQGGTGWTTIVANTVLLGNGANRIATTTAGTNGQVLMLSAGVPTWSATSSSVTSSATTTIFIDSSSATQGACFKMKNATGTAFTYMTVGYGVATFSTISCE